MESGAGLLSACVVLAALGSVYTSALAARNLLAGLPSEAGAVSPQSTKVPASTTETLMIAANNHRYLRANACSKDGAWNERVATGMTVDEGSRESCCETGERIVSAAFASVSATTSSATGGGVPDSPPAAAAACPAVP